MNQEVKHLTTLYVTEPFKPFVVFGFEIVKIVLADKENPLTKCLHENFTKPETWEGMYQLMDNCKKNMKGDDWEIEVLEMYNYYVLNDLILRILKSEYKDILREEFESNVEGFKDFDNITNHICIIAQGTLNAFQDFKVNARFASYMWLAERLPDPFTGISPAMALFGHIPNIPANPKQMKFKDFSDDIIAVLRKSKGHQTFFKNIKCVFSLQAILLDGENPPAKIIKAFFPNMETEISDLSTKLRKSVNKRVIRFTECEFGLLYAATDLYGRVMASSYYNIMSIIIKRNGLTDLETLSDEELAKAPLLKRSSVDNELQLFNEEFGEFDVIKTYREVTAEMPWFDD